MPIVIPHTTQEAFNAVYDHFVTNRGKQSRQDDKCKYRTKDGRKCAIGVLIRDEDYIPELDTDTDNITGCIKLGVIVTPNITPQKSILFLRQLQYWHDRRDHWYEESSTKADTLNHEGLSALVALANQHGLSVPC